MSRFPKVPGAGVKGMSSPIYWTRMHLQNQRYRAQSNAAIERFNERLIRLRNIQNMISNDFVDEVIDEIEGKEAEKMMSYIIAMNSWNDDIEENIEIANNSHLSKYATQIKNVALYSIRLCKKYEKYNDIEDIAYNAKEKMIYLNGNELYFIG